MQWLWLTSRTRGARDRTLWCSWPYDCWSGATTRRLRWFPSICQECTTSRRIPCPESARHWPRSRQWPWSIYDPCLPSGASRRSTCLRHSPTDDSSSSYRHIQTPGQSGQMPCPCLGTTGGASCTRSRHWRWSLKYCRRSLSHQKSGWFWSLNCNRQRRGFPSWWICPKKIRSHCMSKVKTCWLKTFGQATGDRDSSLPDVKSTRVETLWAIQWVKGHSREAANMMSKCPRESSLQVYESHWSRFVAFCRMKRWHMFRVRSHHFSTYMMHLFRDGQLPLTIISHRTSVASVLRHWVYDPAADPHIKLLVRAFRLERPVRRRIMRKWDLHLVLLSLLRPPLASDGDEDEESSDDLIPLKWRTMTCVFLLALASARQRSYLHALSVAPGRCVRQRKHVATICGISVAGTWFSSKESAADPGPWMDHRLTVPGIAHLNPTEAERMLCPVRQLKLYIRDSERIQGGRQRMFIH